MDDLDSLKVRGSSPLTRGKRDDRTVLAAAHGLIPAHAGKTQPSRSSTIPTAAHPRSRGENCWRMIASYLQAGSSPLTRGKRVLFDGVGEGRGLIPAHAGKTSSAVPSATPTTGSSPLTRGKLGSWTVDRDGTGLIPAHAGKTSVVSSWPQHRGAHPRSRGENSLGEWAERQPRGSSPLTRGKRARG